MVLDHAVVDEPAAAGRVGMVVAVVLGPAVRGPAAVADHHRGAAASVHVAQVGRGGAGALEGMDGPVAAEPRQSERVVAPTLRLRGNPPGGPEVAEENPRRLPGVGEEGRTRVVRRGRTCPARSLRTGASLPLPRSRG